MKWGASDKSELKLKNKITGIVFGTKSENELKVIHKRTISEQSDQ